MIGQRSMRVLIVEDNKADARLVRALLEETGMPTQITMVGDGEKAIEMMHSVADQKGLAPDLVLLDINLPKMSGIECVARLRALRPALQIPVSLSVRQYSAQDVRR